MKKLTIYLAILSSVMVGCTGARKIPCTTEILGKIQKYEKENPKKEGEKERKAWFYGDINYDLNLKLSEIDTSDFKIIKRGVLQETFNGSIDEFNVLANTVGGASEIVSPSEVKIIFEKKQKERVVTYTAASDHILYLKTTDLPDVGYVWMPGYTQCEWNGWSYQPVSYPPYQQLQNITRYFTRFKTPNGVEKWYEANLKIPLYVRKKDLRKLKHTSKTASGYKPGKDK